MTVNNLAQQAHIQAVFLADEREIKGIFCGDLLSWAMGRANEGACWCTVMGNLNAVAVASLKEVACILLCENAECSPEVAARAAAVGVNVLKTDLPEFEAALTVARAMGLCKS